MKLDYLPQQPEAQGVSIVQHQIGVEQFSGPLPRPDILKGYEDVISGSAERIIKMAENEAAHRHALEDQVARDSSRDSLLGIIFAFIISMTAIVGGVAIVFFVREAAGAISGALLGFSGIGGIVTTFLKTTRSN